MNPTSPRRHLILGSSLGLVIGATIMILLHESAHAVSGALAGSRPTQLPFAVDDTPALPVDADIVTTLAGPVFSLVSGLFGNVIDWIAVPLRERPFWRMVWLWFVFVVIRDCLRRRRTTRYPSLAMTGLACAVAMVAAGMFEYNFHDSEFLMLFLVLVTLPYAADRAPAHASVTTPLRAA